MEHSNLPAEIAETTPEFVIPQEFPTPAPKKKKSAKKSSMIMALLAGFLSISLYFDTMLPFNLGSTPTDPEEPTQQDTQPPDTSTNLPVTDSITISRVNANGYLEDWLITNVYEETTCLSDGLQLRVLYALSGCSVTTLRDFEVGDYPYTGAYFDNGDGTFSYDYSLLEPHGQWETYTIDTDIYRKAGGGYPALPDGAWFFGDVAYSQSFFVIVGSPGSVPGPAPEFITGEDLIPTFSSAINLLRWWAPSEGVAPGDPFDTNTILEYTAFQLCCDDYGETLVTEGDYSYYASYAIPADVFEAGAADRFAIVNTDELRAVTGYFYDQQTQTGIDDFQYYQADRDVYLFPYQGGWGDASHYELAGYVDNADGTYTVYATFVDIYGEEAPEGEEGVDYFEDDGVYWIIHHHLETLVSLSGDSVRFHSWQNIDAITDAQMVLPRTQLLQTSDIVVEAEADVLPADVVVTQVTPAADQLQAATDALAALSSRHTVYALTATDQPNGLVLVTFNLPEGYDTTHLAVFSIEDDGQIQRLAILRGEDDGTVTAETSQIGLYAVVQLKDPE